MGLCTSKKIPLQQPIVQQETNKDDEIEILEEPQAIEIQNPNDEEDPYSLYLMSHEFEEQLRSNQKFSDHIQSNWTNQQLVAMSLKIGKAIQDLEDEVYKMKSKVTTDILGNYINLALASITNISKEQLFSDQSILIANLCLEVSTLTYHVLKHYIDPKLDEKSWFDEIQIGKDLQSKNMQLQGFLKIELVASHGKVIQTQIKGSNNPMMPMKFNKKHAIGLARQQTVKDNNQEQLKITEHIIEPTDDQDVQNEEEIQKDSDEVDFQQLFATIDTNLIKEMRQFNEKSKIFEPKLKK